MGSVHPLPLEAVRRSRRRALFIIPFALVAAALILLGWPPRAALAQSSPVLTTEVLVLTSATSLPQYASRRGLEVQNLGPAAIWCAVGTVTPVAHKAREIPTGASWSMALSGLIPIRCIAETDQATGAATIVTEVP